MKMKAIAKICSQAKEIVLVDTRDTDGNASTQWIGDGIGMYPIFGLPELDEESVYTIFDIPAGSQDKYMFKHISAPEAFNFNDSVPCENQLENEKLEIFMDGTELIPLPTQCGVSFIDAKYLLPFSGELDVMQLYERITKDGHIYIAAKAGLMLHGLIMPSAVINDDFSECLSKLAKNCKEALSQIKMKTCGKN